MTREEAIDISSKVIDGRTQTKVNNSNMSQSEIDRDMIESIQLFLDEYKPEYVGKEKQWLNALYGRLHGELPSDVEEAAEKYRRDSYNKAMLPNIDGPIPEYGGSIKDAFKAGAEWQREQDQPITGNSLEQEWLRYVDKEKKKYDGDLPSYGEYGWLCIARHFANWQKEQMGEQARKELFKDDLTLADLVAFDEGCKLGRRLERQDMLKEAVEGTVIESFNPVSSRPEHGITLIYEDEGKPYWLPGDHFKFIPIKED